ncbi:MAG: YIP1 family protein [Candidatus Helarchaeota archaeon]
MSYLASLKKSLFNPTEFFEELSKKEPDTIRALLTFIVSSVVLIGAIFFGELINSGDLIYTQFHFQTNTYIIQELTTLKLFGFYISSSNYLLLFLDTLFFFIKMFLIFIGVMLLTAVLLREENELSISKTFEIGAWSSSLFLILGGIVTPIFWGIRLLIPLYYHYAYFFVFVVVLGLFYPMYVIEGLGKSTSASFYKRMLLVFTPMLLIIILWMVNHTDLLLAHML